MSNSDDRLTTSIRRHSLRLGIFALGAALLLTLVNVATADRISEQRREAERAALDAVLPPSNHDNDLLQDSFQLTPGDAAYSNPGLLGLSEARTAYIAKHSGRITGVILPAETPNGYGGSIVMLVGIASDGGITGVRVLQHSETPGLGDQIEIRKSDWITEFDGRSLANTPAMQWQVRKDGGTFDEFVGATITPRAVVAAVYNALTFFNDNREALLTQHNGEHTP